MKNNLCFEEDAFTSEQWLATARWNVVLKSGKKVIQDDGREGLEASAWLRLREYVQQTGDGIAELYLTFRNEKDGIMPSNAEGYFFRKSVLGCLSSATAQSSYIVGYLKDGKVYTEKWNIPILEKVEEEIRDINDDSKVGVSLIINP